MNPWHDVQIGSEAPKIVNAFIEIPMGSQIKYELDKDSGLIRVDRFMSSCVFYPLNYGFIPQTLCEDHDPLDVLILGSLPVVPGCLMEVRVIGVMNMIDQGEKDDKILAVHPKDPLNKAIQDLKEINAHLLLQIRQFFQEYKILDKKKVEVGEFLGVSQGIQVVADSMALYNKMHASKKTK
jgi:inorganic pyrophosphatase